MVAAKHILACSDLSENSVPALRHAAHYAKTHATKITLLHVYDPRAFIPPQVLASGEGTLSTERELRADLEKVRDELMAGLEVEIALLAEHSAARAVVQYAEEQKVDLIVLGSHGRGGIEHWLIGSVAERVVRHAKCNVFVVRV